MNTFYIMAHAEYLTALSYNNITDDVRSNFIESLSDATLEEYDADVVLSEIAFVYMCQVRNYGMSIDDAVAKIGIEYNHLKMNEKFGDFIAYEQFIKACIEVYISQENVIVKHDKFVPLVVDTQGVDGVRYAAGMTILKHMTKSYIMSGKITLIKEIMEIVRNYDEEPVGAKAMMNIIGEATQKDKIDMIR